MAVAPGQVQHREHHQAEPGPRGPILPRVDVNRILPHLPSAAPLRIEVNGVVAGAPRMIPDAITEFATGWAYMHGFYRDPADLTHVVAYDTRVSLMVQGGVEIDICRYQAVGWIDRPDHEDDSPIASPASQVMDERDALATWSTAFQRFAGDGSAAGFSHAALATSDEVLCIARDIEPWAAVAKVIGWALGNPGGEPTMLVVHGMLDELIVRTASRIGIPITVTDGVPTSQALAMASRTGVSVIGLAQSHRRALFADGGHLGIPSRPEDADALPLIG